MEATVENEKKNISIDFINIVSRNVGEIINAMKDYTGDITAVRDIATYEQRKKYIRDNFEILQIVTQTKNGKIKISKEKKYTRLGDPIVFEGLPRLNTFSGYAYYWDKYYKVTNQNGGAPSSRRRKPPYFPNFVNTFGKIIGQIRKKPIISKPEIFRRIREKDIPEIAKKIFLEYYNENDAIYIEDSEESDTPRINAYEVLFSQIISCCQILKLNYESHFDSIYSLFIDNCEYNNHVLYDNELLGFVRYYKIHYVSLFQQDINNADMFLQPNNTITGIDPSRRFSNSQTHKNIQSRFSSKRQGPQSIIHEDDSDNNEVRKPSYARHTKSSFLKRNSARIPHGGNTTRKNKKNITRRAVDV
jgi:hypothetical protein